VKKKKKQKNDEASILTPRSKGKIPKFMPFYEGTLGQFEGRGTPH